MNSIQRLKHTMYSETKNLLYNTESVGMDLYIYIYIVTVQLNMVHEVWVINKSSVFLVMFLISCIIAFEQDFQVYRKQNWRVNLLHL